jgi:UDP-N-acetylmuramoylalanine-D-glutamate ligase
VRGQSQGQGDVHDPFTRCLQSALPVSTTKKRPSCQAAPTTERVQLLGNCSVLALHPLIFQCGLSIVVVNPGTPLYHPVSVAADAVQLHLQYTLKNGR